MTTTMTAAMTTSVLRNKRAVAAVPRPSTADLVHLRAAQSNSKLRKLLVVNDSLFRFSNPGDDYDVHVSLCGKGRREPENHSDLN